MAYEINKRIKYYRTKRGISQRAVADALDLKLSSYSQCERKGQITAERLKIIAKVLQIDVIYLLTDIEEIPDIDIPDPIDPPIIDPENPHNLTKKEKRFIDKLRSLPKEAQDEVIEQIQEIYKRNRLNRSAK